MTIDAFVLLAPVLLLGVVALLVFVGCGLNVVGTAIAPTGTLTANPTTVKSNQSSLLSWTTTDALNASIDHSIGLVAVPSGSVSTGNLAATTTFNLMVLGNGGSATASATVTVTPAPIVSSISPNSGSANGGTSVTITGANFNGPTVTLGGTSAPVVNASSTVIIATTPAHAAGAVTVQVTNSDGQNGALPNGYTYTPAAAGPITFVQAASGPPAVQASNASVSVAFAAAQKAGNLNVVAIGLQDAPASVITVSDSQLNTYTLAATLTPGNGLRQEIFFAPGIKAGINTVQVNFAPAAAFPDVRILEYGGVDTLDAPATASASGTGAAANSGAKTIAKPNELIFGAGTCSNVFSGPGAGFTQRILNPFGNLAEDRTVTAVGSFSATATNTTGAWIMQMVCFFKA